MTYTVSSYSVSMLVRCLWYVYSRLNGKHLTSQYWLILLILRCNECVVFKCCKWRKSASYEKIRSVHIEVSHLKLIHIKKCLDIQHINGHNNIAQNLQSIILSVCHKRVASTCLDNVYLDVSKRFCVQWNSFVL